MSAEPSNPSGSPGRNRPQLSDLSRETTEDDLWNLDEEPAAARPRQQKLTPPPTAAPKEPAAAPEPPAVVEPPMPRGINSPVKPLTPRPPQPDEIGDLDEDEIESAGAEEVVTLTSPIDDEGGEVEKPKPAAPASSSKPKETIPSAPKAKTPAITQVDTPAAPEEIPSPVPAEESPPAKPEAKAEETIADEYADLYEQPYDEPVEEPLEEPVAPAAPRENRPRTAAPAAAGSLPQPRLNRREVIGIASFAVVVMIAAVWVISHFFSQLSFTRDSDSKPHYPLKGELARVASGSTFWRDPVRSGENRDVARREVILIPVLELSLDPEHSGGGALRVIFRNSEGQPLGDPITRSFGAGRFEASGNATVSFAATDGFTTDGDFQGYRTGKGKRWTADVLEGPPGSSPASAFKKLASIPISPDRR